VTAATVTSAISSTSKQASIGFLIVGIVFGGVIVLAVCAKVLCYMRYSHMYKAPQPPKDAQDVTPSRDDPEAGPSAARQQSRPAGRNMRGSSTKAARPTDSVGQPKRSVGSQTDHADAPTPVNPAKPRRLASGAKESGARSAHRPAAVPCLGELDSLRAASQEALEVAYKAAKDAEAKALQLAADLEWAPPWAELRTQSGSPENNAELAPSPTPASAVHRSLRPGPVDVRGMSRPSDSAKPAHSPTAASARHLTLQRGPVNVPTRSPRRLGSLARALSPRGGGDAGARLARALSPRAIAAVRLRSRQQPVV
jgi:hypothetical protein